MAEGGSSMNPLLYNSGFAREICDLESGSQVKRCMQCGVCAVSCASRQEMDITPRKLFSLIRAGQSEAVLNANTIWVCTSCCTCRVRCPRGIDLLEVMHDLQRYCLVTGRVSHPQVSFHQAFWQELRERGRIGEAGVMLRYWLKLGVVGAFQKALEMKGTGLRLLRRGRLPLVSPQKIKGLPGLNRIIDKAQTQREDLK